MTSIYPLSSSLLMASMICSRDKEEELREDLLTLQKQGEASTTEMDSLKDQIGLLEEQKAKSEEELNSKAGCIEDLEEQLKLSKVIEKADLALALSLLCFLEDPKIRTRPSLVVLRSLYGLSFTMLHDFLGEEIKREHFLCFELDGNENLKLPLSNMDEMI